MFCLSGLEEELPRRFRGGFSLRTLRGKNACDVTRCAAGTLAEINWTDERDQDNSILALAAYLIGAGENQFFGAIGWSVPYTVPAPIGWSVPAWE